MFDSPLCRRSLFAARCAALCVASLLLSPIRTPAQASGNQPKRVLLLYSFDNDEGMYSGFDHVLRSELRSGLRDRVEFYTEYLDLVRFPGPAHASNLVKLLKLEFSEQKPDLIIPVSYSAMKFLLEEGKELFPGTPAVALFNSRRLEEVKRRISTGTGRTTRRISGSCSSRASSVRALATQSGRRPCDATTRASSSSRSASSPARDSSLCTPSRRRASSSGARTPGS